MKVVRSKYVCGGQPHIAGTRMTVAHIIRALMARDVDANAVILSYPSITRDHINAALAYAVKKMEQRNG